MRTAWIVKRPYPAGPKDIDSLHDTYEEAMLEVFGKVRSKAYQYSNMDAKNRYLRCEASDLEGNQETWDIEEATLLTSLTVTFTDFPTLTDYEFNIRYTPDWIEVFGSYREQGAGGHEVGTSVILSTKAFDKWVQTDPMFNAADYQGMIDYAVRVDQAPEWFNKFRVR